METEKLECDTITHTAACVLRCRIHTTLNAAKPDSRFMAVFCFNALNNGGMPKIYFNAGSSHPWWQQPWFLWKPDDWLSSNDVHFSARCHISIMTARESESELHRLVSLSAAIVIYANNKPTSITRICGCLSPMFCVRPLVGEYFVRHGYFLVIFERFITV